MLAFKYEMKMTGREQEIHKRAVHCATAYRRSEADLMAAIDDAHLFQVYEKLGYANTFTYCVEALDLPRAAAYYFSTVARKSREIPELREAIVNDELEVSKAARICSVLNDENKDEWLGKAKDLSKSELEKEVAKARPGKAKRSSVKPVAENTTRVAFDADDEFMRDLRRVIDLESQRTGKKAEIPDALKAAVKAYLRKNDKLEKAERARKRSARAEKMAEEKRPREKKTGDIPAANRHQVNLRDQMQCCFVRADGTRCEERKWIDIHHVVPRSRGGSHEVSNLVTLCKHHHMSHHRGA